MRWLPDGDIFALQPLALVRGALMMRTRRPESAVAWFVSAVGVQHPLRVLGSVEMLQMHHRRANRNAVEAEIRVHLERRAADAGPVSYFLGAIVPAAAARDLGHSVPPAAATGIVPFDLAGIAREIASILPPLTWPDSLWVGGRIWQLEAATVAAPGRVFIRCGESTYRVSGRMETAGAMSIRWQAQLQLFLAAAIERYLPVGQHGDSPEVARGRTELQASGVVERGDLLLIVPVGDQPRLAYILPPHRNRSLDRHVDRDVAFAMPLAGAVHTDALELYERTSSGAWRRLSPPSGICLGAPPRGVLPVDPVLGPVSYLRWAAVRVASNGRFHERDGGYAYGNVD